MWKWLQKGCGGNVVASSSSANRVIIYFRHDKNDTYVFLSWYFSLESFQYKNYNQNENYTYERFTNKHFVK